MARTILNVAEAQADMRPNRRALVAFGGDAGLKWLRLLRPGFRHCFVLIESEDRWIMYNPLSIGTEMDVWPGDQEETLRAWLVQHGYRVVDNTVRPLTPKPLGWAPYSCVEAVKRVLGLRAPGIFTPWQLYRHLTAANKKN